MRDVTPQEGKWRRATATALATSACERARIVAKCGTSGSVNWQARAISAHIAHTAAAARTKASGASTTTPTANGTGQCCM